jgi:hypothetical protein
MIRGRSVWRSWRVGATMTPRRLERDLDLVHLPLWAVPWRLKSRTARPGAFQYDK